MKEAVDYLKKSLSRDETIVVACSGGPDSMCLLSLLNNLKLELNLKIIVAHVNHKIRIESDDEAKMVEDYVNKTNNILQILEINEYKSSKFSESDARIRRYKFFAELMEKYNATTLLTAHHGDDLIETILMRLSRGSNLKGYIGIKKQTKNQKYQILRPLLFLCKDEILNYVKKESIPYVVDNSNNNESYTRNRYRKVILPFLHQEQSDINKKYLKFSEELQDYEEFIDSYINDKKFIVDNSIVINKVRKESTFIKRKCIEKLINVIQENDLLEVNDKITNDLLNLLELNNKSIDLNNGYKAINSYNEFKIIKDKNKTFEEFIISSDRSINNFNFYYNSKEGNTTNSCIYLDSLELAMPLKIRCPKVADKMTVKNLKGTKKLSDIFTNSKIPKQERRSYPILVDSNNNIIWVPNVKKSQFAKDKSQKYDIIINCEER